MDNLELLAALEKSYKTYFPHGFFRGKVDKSFGSEWILFRIGLIAEIGHCSSSIRENDPAFGSFKVTPDDFVVDCFNGHTLSCIPDPKTHNAMSCRKIGFRKAKKKSFEEIATYMDKYFQKMRLFVDENKHEIYHVETYPELYLRAPTKLEKALY